MKRFVRAAPLIPLLIPVFSHPVFVLFSSRNLRFAKVPAKSLSVVHPGQSGAEYGGPVEERDSPKG